MRAGAPRSWNEDRQKISRSPHRRGNMMIRDDEEAGDRPSISALLLQLRAGDSEAMNRLFPLVYGELRRLAHWQLQHERTGHTLDTGALVHETYLKMVDQPRVHWQDRAHFFRVASWAMRRILVD